MGTEREFALGLKDNVYVIAARPALDPEEIALLPTPRVLRGQGDQHDLPLPIYPNHFLNSTEVGLLCATFNFENPAFVAYAKKAIRRLGGGIVTLTVWNTQPRMDTPILDMEEVQTDLKRDGVRIT